MTNPFLRRSKVEKKKNLHELYGRYLSELPVESEMAF
jgi:hypothetical protein